MPTVCIMRFLSFFGTASVTHKLQSFFFLEVSLNLTLFQRKPPNYQKSEGYLEHCFRL